MQPALISKSTLQVLISAIAKAQLSRCVYAWRVLVFTFVRVRLSVLE